METTLTQAKTSALAAAENNFATLCAQANELELANNASTAFRVAGLITQFRAVLTDEIMNQIFIPLSNSPVGFLTDRDPKKKDKNGIPLKPYSVDEIRECIIAATIKGVNTVGNQFNIIAGRPYVTNEGYSFLLKKIHVRHLISKAILPAPPNSPFVDVKCVINYEKDGEQGKPFSITVQCKQDAYSSPDQIKGKADRKAKKTLYEFLTGEDIRDGDVVSADDDLPVDDQSTTAIDDKKQALRDRRASGEGQIFEMQ